MALPVALILIQPSFLFLNIFLLLIKTFFLWFDLFLILDRPIPAESIPRFWDVLLILLIRGLRIEDGIDGENGSESSTWVIHMNMGSP